MGMRDDTLATTLRRRLAAKRGKFKQTSRGYGPQLKTIGAQLNDAFGALFEALDDVPVDMGKLFHHEAVETYKRIKRRTPIDTGRARAGWLLDDASVYHYRGATRVRIKITNAVPYVRYLEYGWSKQAPAGMVRISLLELEQRVKQATKEYLHR